MSSANVSDDNVQDKNKLEAKKSYVAKLLTVAVKDENFILETCFDLSTKKYKTATEVFLTPGIDAELYLIIWHQLLNFQQRRCIINNIVLQMIYWRSPIISQITYYQNWEMEKIL